MVQTEMQISPESALEWTERIHDPTERRNLTVRFGSRWLHADPESAHEWLENSGLAEDIQTEIQQAPEIRQTPFAPTQRPVRRAPSDHSGLEVIRNVNGVEEA